MNRTDATNVQVGMATDSTTHTEVTIAPEVAAVLDGTSQYAVVCGDATAVMATIPSGIASVAYCDPPYGLSKQDTASIVECLTKWLAGQVYEHNTSGFMGSDWDGFCPGPEAWREVHRALKPGGYCVAFSSTRTVDLLGMAIRLGGFELRNGWAWTFGAGFPKSLDVSKAIDSVNGEGDRLLKFTEWMRATGIKASRINAVTETYMGSHYLSEGKQKAIPTPDVWSKLRPICGEVPAWVDELVERIEAERDVVGKSENGIAGGTGRHAGAAKSYGFGGEFDITAPATDDAKTWSGYGTDVKPAYEPLIVARKELQGTVAANVLAHGCGALNIDAARITGTVQSGAGSYGFGAGREDGYTEGTGRQYQSAGRYPASIAFVHDEECELVGVTKVKSSDRCGYSDRDSPAGILFGTGNGGKKSMHSEIRHGDPDGTETVDDWQCTPTCAVAELARQSGVSKDGVAVQRNGGGQSIFGGIGNGSAGGVRDDAGYGGEGSAARFFYNAKASANDRLAYVTCSDGCEHHNSVTGVREAKTTARDATAEQPYGACVACGAPRKHYQHPTVKPLSLARHHAKLLSLPAHLAPIALVPFCGTGIEAAALLEAGFRVIAIDLDPRHCAMTEYRLANIGLNADEPKRRVTGKPAAKVAPAKVAKPTAQLDLFGAK